MSTMWNIDPAHSEIQFKVKHLMITTVTGSFPKFSATMTTEGDSMENAQISFTADVASLTTGIADRDNHLKSDDFFNAEQFPVLSFTSVSFQNDGGNAYKLIGDLTIRDYTHRVELDVEYMGTVSDPYGQTKAGFEISGKVKRKDYGLKWNAVTEAGGVVVSDDVKIAINVQMVKQA